MSEVRHTQFLRIAITLSGAITALGLTPVKALAQSTALQEQIEAIQQDCAKLADAARERSQPLPEGEQKLLCACVIAVKGSAQWNANTEGSSWVDAKVHHMLKPGAKIRTGLDSSLMLRVGQNATVLVDQMANLELPEIVQDGDTLRTTVGLKFGRADFKVDQVGLINDVSVVTPSATLAVQGTGYAVKYGGFDGTEITAARLNEMHAIEVRYFTNLFTYYLSGGAISSDRNRDPVIAELFDTIGPSPLISAIIEADATPEMLANTLTISPIREGRRVDTSMSGIRNTLASVFDRSSFGFHISRDLTDAEVAQFTCENLRMVFREYADLLTLRLPNEDFRDPQNALLNLCTGANEFQDDHLQRMVGAIIEHCGETDFECIINFGLAVTEVHNHN